MDEAKIKNRSAQVPDAAVIRRVMEVYERGQTVEALRRAETFAPLSEWGGVSSCVLAARIAGNTGAPRLEIGRAHV